MVIAKPSFRVPTSYTLRDARRHPYPRPQYRDEEADDGAYQPYREDDVLIQLILENDGQRAEGEEVLNIEEEDIEEIPVLSLILLQLLLIMLLFLRRALIMAFILRYIDEEE
ncbi:hypothetical protein VNI00_004756 [Paramarasmius palmivorus]|uniref:Uncharacterized protein n=1 Tax=Paramarasmius palmivorus TaxID=297713 RepID=A0AAW0DIV9_9AGAR